MEDLDGVDMEKHGDGPAKDILIGRNPVREALKSGRAIDKIMVAQGDKKIWDIINLAKEKSIPIYNVDRDRLDLLSGNSRHQGVMAYIAAREYADVDDLLSANGGKPPLLLLLDEINDPRNLGAIIRTSEAAGVHGVVIPKRRSVSLNQTVASASAGAVEYIPVARVTNMVQTMEMLKEKGIWIVGADANAPELYWQVKLDGPLAIVIGGEGKGLGRLVREKCDLLVRFPMMGRIGSLNASVATALLLYEVLRQRGYSHEGDPAR